MTFDDTARARVARGWASTSLDQRTYAAQHAISPRTLREWVCRFGGTRRPHARLRAAIVASIEQLQNLLAALDAEAAADSAAAPASGAHPAEHEVERHAGAAEAATAVRPAPASSDTGPLAPSTPTLDTGRATDARLPVTACDSGAMDQPGQGSSAGNESRAVLDFDALRKRAAQRRAARATAGMKKPFDWEAE